ncbi:hypothetical protein D2T29_13810 [Sinirhodobacter populi]|uniref:Fibronectin type-III domain-containing protein n=1 Tax=Paenirhodobacter populi TaxID=2306993 RepID=A0A443KAP6_9RHOB|nr:hypothetical protein [Sinirhodobacter populi]RWR29854.1 hypothetical protein D2T29_13810 [Sinirhodobacter populi]
MGFRDYRSLFLGGERIIAAYRGDIPLFGDVSTLPGRFEPDLWALSTGATPGTVLLHVLSLPESGGGPVTALEYALEDGSWTALSGAGPGTYTLQMPTAGVDYVLRLRAVNALGAGPASQARGVRSGAPAATVPASFTASDWTIAAGNGAAEVVLTVLSLPADGGAALTAVQYTTDGGQSWMALPGLSTGAWALTMAEPATAYAFALRAVNAIGAGAMSTAKEVASGAAIVSGGTISMTQLVSNRVYQRQAATGGLFGLGEAVVSVSGVAQAAVSLVQYRLRDADTNAVLVPWSTAQTDVPAGAFTLNLTLPAAQRFYNIDLRPEGDDSRAVTGTARFAVGRVVLGVGQSQLGRMFGKVDTAGGTIAALVPGASAHAVVRGIYTGNGMETSTANAGWQVPADGGAYASTGAAEFLRREVAEHGVVCAFVGYGLSGGVISQLLSGSRQTQMRDLIAETGAWEAFWFYLGGSDAVAGTTEAVFAERLASLMADVNSRNGYAGPVTRIFTATGTRTSETMAAVLNIRRAVAAAAAAEGGIWFEPRSSALVDQVHPSQAGNVTLGAALHRAFAGHWNEPVLTSATRSGAVLTLNFTTSDGAAMTVSGNPVGRVAVYPAGTTTGSKTVASVTAAGSTVMVTLASDPGGDVDVWLYPHPDSNTAAFLAQFIGDSYTADGQASGRPARASLQAVTAISGEGGGDSGDLAATFGAGQITLTGFGSVTAPSVTFGAGQITIDV